MKTRICEHSDLSRYGRLWVSKEKECFDYDDFEISWGNSDYYEVVKKLGCGHYSQVYEGLNTANGQRCVIKILKPIKTANMKREIKVLQILCGGPNIVGLYDIIKDPLTGISCLVFEYTSDTELTDLYQSFTDFDVRHYVYQVLKALDYCHSQGIMHRDIKPGNIIVNPEERSLQVIDWGLAEFYVPKKEYSVNVASRYYKGPELLINDTHYAYSLDIWSLGCVLAEIIFKKRPFFQGNDNNDQLAKIVQVLGSDDLIEYMKKHDLPLDSECEEIIGFYPKIPFACFVNSTNRLLANPDAINLLQKMLVYNKAERISAKEAMEHKYFNPVRNNERNSLKL